MARRRFGSAPSTHRLYAGNDAKHLRKRMRYARKALAENDCVEALHHLTGIYYTGARLHAESDHARGGRIGRGVKMSPSMARMVSIRQAFEKKCIRKRGR
jgi:hypothetical protein